MKLLRTQAEMVEAYRQRIRELGITFATVDAISGLPDGYTAKLMGPNPIKGLGEKAIEGLNGALGIGFVVTEDLEQVQRVQGRWTKRKRPFFSKRPSVSLPVSIPVSIDCEVHKILNVSAAFMALIADPKSVGRNGGKARARNLSPMRRKLIARKAAKARWAKEGANHA